MNWAPIVNAIISKLPIERLFTKERSEVEKLEKLKEILNPSTATDASKERARILWTRETSQARIEILKKLALEIEPYWAQPWAKLPLHYREAIATYYERQRATESQKEGTSQEGTTSTIQSPEKVRQSASTGVVTREGLDPERLAWQDSIIRSELWLLEGHLKNKCISCGGDLDCCFKHCLNIIDATGETQSMTTEGLYQQARDLAQRVQPFVHPEDVRGEKYIAKYPAFVIEVSQIRTQFDNRLLAHMRPELTLEEAKQMAAEEAAKEVEKRWQSQEKK